MGWRRGIAAVEALAPAGAGGGVLCAGASQRDLVDRGVRDLHIDRHRLFGTAPEALAAGARASRRADAQRLAPRHRADRSSEYPPNHTVIPWDDAAFGGFAADSALIDEPVRRRSARAYPRVVAARDRTHSRRRPQRRSTRSSADTAGAELLCRTGRVRPARAHATGSAPGATRAAGR